MRDETNSEVQDTLLIAGGIALIAFGAGMILANSSIRSTVLSSLLPLLPHLKDPMNASVSGVMPDVERYLRLKAM